jgi:thiol-disulfide isomerase/thioredoxin
MLFAPPFAPLFPESAMRSFAALAVLIGLALAVSGCDKRSGDAAQGAANGAAANAGAAPDEVTADEVTSDEVPSDGAAAGEPFKHTVDRSHKGEAMPDKAFTTLDGKPATLKQIAAGKPMLVNLWATWCAPCIAELPALDKVAAVAKARGVAVIAVSQDLEGKSLVPSFWSARKLGTLQTWLDAENALGFHYATGTLPTTILYDAQGEEVLRIVGALEWGGPEGRALAAEIGG